MISPIVNQRSNRGIALVLQKAVLAVLSLVGGGCKLVGGAAADYQTIGSESQYDTEAAQAEHEKAVKVIERHLDGKRGDLAKAEKHLQDALVADVTYGPAHNSLGLVYYLQRRLYLAAWEYEYASKLMPDRMEPVYNLALIYECAGDLNQAIATYELALSMRPQDPYVLGGLASARLRNGDSVEDVRPLLQELSFYDTRPDWIAWAKEHLGTHPERMVQRDQPTADLQLEQVPRGSPTPADQGPELSAPQNDTLLEAPLPPDMEPLPAP